MEALNAVTNNNLYSIRQDHYELIQMIEDADGEVTPEIEEALQLNADQLNAKAVSYGYVIKSYKDKVDIISKEITRLTELKNKAVMLQEAFIKVISTAMQERSIEKIETPTLKLSFRKSEAVEISDERMIPAEFTDTKVVETISKSKIKDALKAGIEVPGAELVTRQNLQIR